MRKNRDAQFSSLVPKASSDLNFKVEQMASPKTRNKDLSGKVTERTVTNYPSEEKLKEVNVLKSEKRPHRGKLLFEQQSLPAIVHNTTQQIEQYNRYLMTKLNTEQQPYENIQTEKVAVDDQPKTGTIDQNRVACFPEITKP